MAATSENIPSDMCASEESDKCTLSRRLIRIFNGRILDRYGCKVCSCERQRLRSDCDALVVLSLRWTQTVRFYRTLRDMLNKYFNEFKCISVFLRPISFTAVKVLNNCNGDYNIYRQNKKFTMIYNAI